MELFQIITGAGIGLLGVIIGAALQNMNKGGKDE